MQAFLISVDMIICSDILNLFVKQLGLILCSVDCFEWLKIAVSLCTSEGAKHFIVYSSITMVKMSVEAYF